jgi:uncharacterized protein YndB with AHSA1/START domain
VEYQRERRIYVSPDAVFAFVTDVENLPTFVPTVEMATPAAEGRVRLSGKVGGNHYEDEGWLHVDHNQRGLEWGVETREYTGWMTVTGANMDGTETDVVVHLSLPPHESASGRPLTGERAAEPDPIEAGLEASLDSLRNILEGTGGKERPDTLS